VLIDAGYGNNTTFLSELEKRKLKYLGGLAKNRKVIIESQANKPEEIRLDDLARINACGSFHSDSTQSR
jgi:SRSO17 transposase